MIVIFTKQGKKLCYVDNEWKEFNTVPSDAKLVKIPFFQQFASIPCADFVFSENLSEGFYIKGKGQKQKISPKEILRLIFTEKRVVSKIFYVLNPKKKILEENGIDPARVHCCFIVDED